MLEQAQTILRPPKRKVVRFTAAIPSVLDFGLGNLQDRQILVLSAILPQHYALSSESQGIIGVNVSHAVMDSGANAFMFPPEGTRTPSLHCLISATSGPAAESLDHGTASFGLIDSEGHTHCFRESVYIHDALPFALFPVSCLSERGVYFDFYSISNLFYGSVVFPFAQRAGLYMGKLLCAAELSAASVMCAAVLSPFGYHTALVVKSRSSAQDVSNSAVPLAEIEISSHCASPPDNGVPLVLVKDGEQAVQEGLILDMPPLTSEVLDTTWDTGCINQLRHRLTGAGKLLLDLHDRRSHPHDHALKQMVDSKQSGCDHLSWVPGLHIRDYHPSIAVLVRRVNSVDLKLPSTVRS